MENNKFKKNQIVFEISTFWNKCFSFVEKKEGNLVVFARWWKYFNDKVNKVIVLDPIIFGVDSSTISKLSSRFEYNGLRLLTKNQP